MKAVLVVGSRTPVYYLIEPLFGLGVVQVALKGRTVPPLLPCPTSTWWAAVGVVLKVGPFLGYVGDSPAYMDGAT